MVISPFGAERGLVYYYCLLENRRATAPTGVSASVHMDGLYRDKSYNALIVIGTTSIYLIIIYKYASWADRPHVSYFYALGF